MENEREKLIILAKLAYQAERYDDKLKSMRKVCEDCIELSEEERELLSISYKNVMVTKRASLRILSLIERKENSKGNQQTLKLIKKQQEIVKNELFNVCNDILSLIDSHLIPSTSNVESIVYFYRMKGNYFRYMAEFGSDDQRKEAAGNSNEAYKAAMEMAVSGLSPTNLVRRGLALNFAILNYEILKSTKSACKLANQPYEEAIAELDGLDKRFHEDALFIIKIVDRRTEFGYPRTQERRLDYVEDEDNIIDVTPCE